MTAMPHGQGSRSRHETRGLLRLLAKGLESRGLATDLDTSFGDMTDDTPTEMIVVSNPAAPERGRIEVYDDGSVTWDFFRDFDQDSMTEILEEVAAVLRTGDDA